MKRNLLIKSLFLLALLCWSLSAGAQNNTFNPDMPSVPLLTPEASSLGRYGSIPVSEYTGVPAISIPLHTLTDGELELPLSLTYHASGIKVNQESTWVGLGWDLQAGGCINHILSGSYDKEYVVNTAWNDWERFFAQQNLPFQTTGDNSVWGGTEENPGSIYRPSLYQDLLYGMGEPDIFHACFCGQTLTFIIHPGTRQPILVGENRPGCKVEALDEYGNSWKITDTEGIQYIFGQNGAEWMETRMQNYISSWFLTEIIHPQKGHILLEYETEGDLRMKLLPPLFQEYTEAEYDSYIDGKGNVSAGNPDPELLGLKDNLLYNDAVVKKKYLKSITAGLVRVDFHKSIREDIAGYSRKLDSMVVNRLFPVSEAVKRIAFDYGYFTGVKAGGDYLEDKAKLPADAYRYKRLKLESVCIGSQAPYRFEYNTSTPLPYKTSYATDFWGYYNGRDSNKSFLCSATLKELSIDPGTIILGDANRYADPEKMKAGILTKIIYPTQGYTVLEYESNTFVDNATWCPAAADVKPGGGTLHTFSVLDCQTSSEERSKIFTLSEETEVEVEFVVNSRDYYLADLTAASATLAMGNGTHVHRYAIPAQQLGEKSHSYTYSEKLTLPKGTYSMSCQYPADKYGSGDYCISLTQLTVKYRTFGAEDSGYKGFSYGGGLRVSSISGHDTDGTLLHRREYEYTAEDGSTSGKLLLPVPKVQTDLFYVGYSNNETLTYSLECWKSYTLASSAKVPAITSLSGSPVGYSRVTVREVKGQSSNGETITLYHNSPAIHYFYGTYLFGDFLNGKPSEQVAVDKSGNPVRKQQWIYGSVRPQILMLNAFATDLAPGIADSFLFCCLKRYRIQAYPFSCGWNPATEIRVTDYTADGGRLENYTKYAYKSEGSCPSTVVTVTSRGDTLETRFLYAEAFRPTDVYARMYALNMLDYPVETIVSQNGQTVSRTRNEYVLHGDRPRPSVLLQAKGEGEYVKRMEYTRYDADGNLLEQKGPDRVVVSWLWSYRNCYPVACIKGMDYDTVVATLTQPVVSSINNSIEGTSQLLDIQSRLSSDGVTVTAWTHSPAVGMQSAIEPNGNLFTYEYDDSCRLIRIRDRDGKHVEQYDYHYKVEK